MVLLLTPNSFGMSDILKFKSISLDGLSYHYLLKELQLYLMIDGSLDITEWPYAKFFQ